MKRALLGMLAITMLVMNGCGEGSILVYIPIGHAADPPSISLHMFTNDTTEEYIDGSVVYYAPDYDIDTITVAVFDSNWSLMSRTETALTLPGSMAGTIPFSIDYITYPPGTYTFSIYLTDFNDYNSNQVVDTFRVQ